MRFTLLDNIELDKLPKPMRQAIAQKEKSLREEMREHEARIRPLLTPALRRLQDIPWTEMSDAQFRSLKIDAARRTVEIRLFCCGDQAGYYHLYLQYSDVQLSGELISILCFLAHSWDELDQHEIDIEQTQPHVFIHRIQWRTSVVTDRNLVQGIGTYSTLAPETELRFGSIKIKRIATHVSRHAKRQSKITVVREADDVRIARYLSSVTLN